MSFWSALDPTNANSALGGYIKQGISLIPGVGTAAASTLTNLGASNAAAAQAARQQAPAGTTTSLRPAAPSSGRLGGFPMTTLLVVAGAAVALFLILKRR